jgi:hypothetical protein
MSMSSVKPLPYSDLIKTFDLSDINRLTLDAQASASITSLKYRILVISNSPDQSKDYVSMMGCIFLAQKKVILITPLYPFHSLFLLKKGNPSRLSKSFLF